MMPPYLDSVIRISLALGAGLVALLAWSLRQNLANVLSIVQANDRKLENIATDMRQLSATVGTHAQDIAVLRHAQDEHDRRIAGLEDRERERAA